jgi:hypothetical protein
MKVVLDISWLGYDDSKVGLWRAIENLGLGLARHPGCEVRLSAEQQPAHPVRIARAGLYHSGGPRPPARASGGSRI